MTDEKREQTSSETPAGAHVWRRVMIDDDEDTCWIGLECGACGARTNEPAPAEDSNVR